MKLLAGRENILPIKGHHCILSAWWKCFVAGYFLQNMHIAKLTAPDVALESGLSASFSEAHVSYRYALLSAWSPWKSWAHFPALPAKKKLREDTGNTGPYFPQSTATRDLPEFLRMTYTLFGAWCLWPWKTLLDLRKGLGCQADLVSQRWPTGSEKGFWVTWGLPTALKSPSSLWPVGNSISVHVSLWRCPLIPDVLVHAFYLPSILLSLN